MFTPEYARALLTLAGVFFPEDEAEDDPTEKQTINLNDAFYWACSDGEKVEDSELERVADLFWHYGYAGIMYWVAVEKRGGETPEFLDVRRHIEFVQNEENLRKEVPNSSTRAYRKLTYTIGKE